MAQMDTFEYKPIDLERPAFRLLQLLQGNGPVIKCRLFQAYLGGTDTVPYDALSYTWGAMEKTAAVTVNGKALNVTENLYSALQHLRSKDEDRILWADAICINQSDDRERGHQVQQMRDIYSQAEEVIIWLGYATNQTNFLMDSLRRLEEHTSKHEHKNWDLKQWTTFWTLIPQNPMYKLSEGLDLLLRRPWFRRVWILQEVAKANRASVWCGTKSAKAHTFALAPSLLGVKPERHCQAVLDIMPGRLRGKSVWRENRSLYNLLLKFGESEASDPRDRVYALLGISSDAWNTDSLRPDYRKSLQTVIHDTALFLFGPSNVYYKTMSKLLKNLASRNADCFSNLARASGVREVEHFLTQRELEVPLSEGMITAAAENKKNGSDILRLLIGKCGSEFKVTDGTIQAAVENGGIGSDLLNLLLQQYKSKVGVPRTLLIPLKAASASGDDVVVKLLLEKGADVNNGIALCAASSGGHEAVVRLLLEKGANVNNGNALCAASSGGHEAVVRLLLNRGADVNAKSGQDGNALYAASSGGHEAVVRLLLNRGADVNAESGPNGNALYAASSGGHEAVVRLLLNRGADVNAESGPNGNALYAASSRGYEAVVRLLLEKGADVNYDNALYTGPFGGHEVVVKVLLKEGADINAQSRLYRTALYAASYEGYEAIVQLLLEKGADINAQGGQFGTAVYAALSRGHKAVVRLLRTKGANFNAQDSFYHIARREASFNGKAVARPLLKRGANVNAQGG
jgi:ankyrin repeat protein